MKGIQGSNDNQCKNVGYHKLTYKHHYVDWDTTLSEDDYGKNERCYWAFWAPGNNNSGQVSTLFFAGLLESRINLVLLSGSYTTEKCSFLEFSLFRCKAHARRSSLHRDP